jgi:DUF971 family protein
VGESCPRTVSTQDETYYMNDMVCAEMHDAHTAGIKGWHYAMIVGTGSEAIFQRQEDMWAWVESQPYVRTKAQVH